MLLESTNKVSIRRLLENINKISIRRSEMRVLSLKRRENGRKQLMNTRNKK